MYYIRMVPRTAGSKRNRQVRRTEETYSTLEAAKEAMHKYVHEQEKLSMRQLGLVDFKITTINDGLGVIMEIKPALRLIKGLILTFIIETEAD